MNHSGESKGIVPQGKLPKDMPGGRFPFAGVEGGEGRLDFLLEVK